MPNVDWAQTGVIDINISDMVLVSPGLYDFDLVAFHESLRYLEAQFNEGIHWQRTHDFNREVTFAGTTFAPQVILLAPYSVRFPDQQITVRLYGANTNIFDVQSGFLKRNQCQVIPSNSAGLIISSGGVSAQDKSDIAQQVWNEVL